MNVIVCVKQTFDTEAIVKLNQEGRIDESGVKLLLNPFDEYAIEEAIRLIEKVGGQVMVVTASKDEPSKVLQYCIAMGVSYAVWIDLSEINDPDCHTYAEVLGQWLKTQQYDLIFCGREAVDDGASEVPSRLAEILDLPQVNVVSELNIDGRKCKAKRDIEGGWEIVECNLPALLTTQKDLNTPRYPSMRRILEAKRTKIERVTLEELDEAIAPYTCVKEFTLPPPRQAGKVVTGTPVEVATSLISFLREKKVI